MNIREHIEAGHYPSLATGVHTVPMRDGNTAFIYTTKHHPEWPIVGGIDGETEPFAWHGDGSITNGRTPQPQDLLPPPPRKATLREWAVHSRLTGTVYCHCSSAEQAEKAWLTTNHPSDWRVVELTGEYEEPWPVG